MYKTIFAVRCNSDDEAYVDCCMSVEWPDRLTGEALTTLAEIRNESQSDTLKAVVTPEVWEFLRAYGPLEMRVRLNDMSGPYVVDSKEVPSDAELLLHFEQMKKKQPQP